MAQTVTLTNSQRKTELVEVLTLDSLMSKPCYKIIHLGIKLVQSHVRSANIVHGTCHHNPVGCLLHYLQCNAK